MTISSDLSYDGNGPVWTEDELVAFCLRMKPTKAAELNDSSLCVSPLIESFLVDGETKSLLPVDGRYGAANVRVSTIRQRSPKTAEGAKPKKRKTYKIQGFSEQEQLSRAIRYFVAKGQAFKVYSDAGVTGEFPNNDPATIQKLWAKKAARYHKIFERALLDEQSLERRTPEEVASMRAYLDRRVSLIQSGAVTEETLYKTEPGDDAQEPSPLTRTRTQRTSHRQGFTQLWWDVEADLIHTIAATDRSRLTRDADLESAFLEVVFRHGTRLHGLVEDMAIIDVSDPLKKGLNYLLASVNEQRIEDISSACFRGTVQLLESRSPTGKLPWWLQRDDAGRAVFISGGREAAQRVVDLYLAGGLGSQAVARKVYQEGYRSNGKPISRGQVQYLVHTSAITGINWRFGIGWKVYPAVLEEPDIIAELADRVQQQRDAYPRLPGPLSAAVLFAGLLKCSCGKAMRYQRPDAAGNSTGSQGQWSCDYKGAPGHADYQHATINQRRLADFVRELLKDNPNLLTGALAASLGGSAADRAARRAILEERLEVARQEYRAAETAAQEKARQAAIALGLSERSPRFAPVIAEMSQGLLEASTVKLEALTTEMNHLRAQTSQDKRAAEFTEAVACLKGWDDLDTLTQNRLLRAVFERITAYTRVEGGHLEIKLVGVDTPLPPVRRYAINRKEMRFPTPSEWLEDMCGLSSQPPVALLSRDMEWFRDYVRQTIFEGDIELLAQRIRADASFPTSATSKRYNLAHLERQGLSATECRAFHDLFDQYTRAQRERQGNES